MPMITDDDYAEIRALIDVSIDATIVPDAIIGMDSFRGAAERMVLARDPDAANRSGVEAIAVRQSALCFCAALLIPTIPNITHENFGEQNYTRQALNVEERKADLLARGNAVIDSYLMPVKPTLPPFVFGTASRGRRR